MVREMQNLQDRFLPYANNLILYHLLYSTLKWTALRLFL